MGQWVGNFSSISATDADSKNMFCLLDDGSWARFTSTDNAGAKLNAFRAYFLSGVVAEPNENPSAARAQAPANQKVFRTLFSNAGITNVSDGSIPDALNILYNADIPTPTVLPTDISPIIQTIESDGTSRYFDLQGRMLIGKPNKGIYITDGKKVIMND